MKKVVLATALAVSPLANAGTLVFEWTEPTTNVDGSSIVGEPSYEIRYGDGTTDQVVSAVGTTHSVEVGDEPAVYYAQIRTVVGTSKSEWSTVITTSAVEYVPVPNAPTFTMKFECDGCNLIVQP